MSRKRSLRPSRIRRARVEELESRILLSADLPGAGLTDPVHPDDAHGIVEPFVARNDVASVSEQHAVRRELVFVDTAVDDWETLVDDLLGRSSDTRSVEVVLLDSERDGLAQISETLARTEFDLDAVHVVSHGTGQGIQLGGTWLDQTTLDDRADLVAGWRAALSEDADLLLYGCNLGASSEGKALIGHLAELTGADVAASSDLTGAAALGGDWDLEHTTGAVESFVIFTARAQQAFGGVLGGTAIWSENSSSAPQTRDFDGTNFGPESNTAAVGEWKVIAGAEAPTRDEMIVLGTNSGGDLSGQIWDGSTWSALPGVVAGLNGNEWSFDVAYESHSGDALMVWADPAGGISYATWDGVTFGAAVNFAAPGGLEPNHIRLAADPNSNDIMAIGSIDGVADIAMVWDGTAFVDGQILRLGAGSLTAIDVVYEGLSGDAMVVYGDASDVVHYEIYDGATWAGGIVSDPSGGPSSSAQWTQLASDPNSDRIAMIVGTDFHTAWLAVWDGNAWQPSVLAGNNTIHTDRQNTAIAFESTSGEAIAAYTRLSQDEVRYRRWTPGGGWSGELLGPTLASHPDSLTLDPDPNSDAIMLSVVEDSRQLDFLVWDGSSWGAPNVLEPDVSTNVAQPFLFIWEQGVAVNTAPVLTPAAPSLPTITEDQTNNAGVLVSSLLGSSVSDPDAGAVGGIAITGLTSSNGAWEYTIDAGLTWTAVGPVSSSSALLLRDGDRIRFVPDGVDADAASFDFRAWDQKAGSPGGLADTSSPGGSSAFSLASDTASIVVTALNDAPVLSTLTPVSLNDVAANSGAPLGAVGTLVSSLVDLLGGGGLDNVSDVDPGPVTGLAVTGVDPTKGTFYYSIDDGASWLGMGAPTINNARLLAAEPGVRIYFEPDPGASGTLANVLRFRAWDQTTGVNGGLGATSPPGGTSAYSALQASIGIDVTATAPSGVDSTVNTDEDLPYAFKAADFGFSDADGDLLQGVIVATVPGAGTLRNGAMVLTGGEAISKVDIDAGNLVFTPVANQSGTPYTSFTFQVKDDSGATGSDTDATPRTLTIDVDPINDAPVQSPAPTLLPTISEDAASSGGVLVSSLLAGASDPDAGALSGIAITDTTSNGTWEYSTDGGTIWNAVGAVSDSSARLLRSSDLVRFAPDARNGETADFDFVVWDQTSGTAGGLGDASSPGGSSAYSLVANTVSITISDVNDAPVLDDTGNMTLNNVIANDPNPPGDTVASIVLSATGDRITDVDNGDPEGIAVLAVDNTNGTWQYSTDGGTVWIPFGAVSETTALLLDEAARVRFVPNLSYVGSAGDIDFRAWDQTSGVNGQSGVDTSGSRNGGITAFSTTIETATLQVTSLNLAPVLVPSSPSLPSLGEDETDDGGQSVAAIVGASITDLDAGAVEGIAITGLSSGNGTWEYSLDGGTVWNAVPLGVADTSALLLGDTDLVRFVPDGQNADAASFDFRAWDRTTGTAGTQADASNNGVFAAFSGASDTASITVTAVNDAPTLMPTSPSLPTIDEDDTNNGGALVSSLLGGASDVDTAALQGLAITALSSGNGSWEYSLDDGTSWNAVPLGVADASALQLRGTDLVRFVPDGQNADSASFDFRAWDQTTGAAGALANTSPAGGITAFSPGKDTANVTVTAVNDAPSLNPAAPSLTGITEDDTNNGGDLVSSLLPGSITDIDAGAQEGIAITALSSGSGTWEYSTDGGALWNAVGVVSPGSALLLRDIDRVRFVPDGSGADAASFDFHAWDQSSGTAGALADASSPGSISPFSAGNDTASIAVGAVNDAPVLTPSAPSLTPISEDDLLVNPGDAVATLIAGSISDADGAGPLGIAVTALTSSNGAWEYSIDGGSVWNAVGAVSDASALLLRDTDRVRFIPDGQNADAASFDFRAWDRSTGSAGSLADASIPGGTSAFSVATDTASITVSAANDAPVLTPTAPTLPTIGENDTSNAGERVSMLLAGAVSDVDAGALFGVAITGLTNGNGSWEYSIDGGSSWNAIGAVSDASALLLRDSDRVRFVPDGRGADSASLDFRAWDQTTGTAGGVGNASSPGGASAFSSASDTASINVTAVNDAPVMLPSAPSLPPITEDDLANPGETVSNLLGSSVSDPDGTLVVEGIAITSLASSNGTWQYSVDGGTVWNGVGPVSDSNALLLRDTDRVRFVPDGLNADAASFAFRAWDQSGGAAGSLANTTSPGGSSRFSLASDTASIAVSSVNDAPVLDATGTMTLADVAESDPNPGGATVAAIIASAGGDRITDVDTGAVEGIAVTGVDDSDGTWQYSTDGGTIWTNFGAASDSAAVLLDIGDLVRFVPDPGYTGSAGNLTFRAWDQSAGMSGQTGVDVSTNGGTTAYGSTVETGSLNIAALNAAPVLTPSSPSLTSISEDDTGNPGDDVSAIVGGSIGDMNLAALEGIAVTGLSSGNGDWEYSTDGGVVWLPVGSVSSNSALLLRDVDKIRFVPDGRNADSASLDFRAWDQTTGAVGSRADASANGGTTAFSSASDSASISVSAVNDAPSLTGAAFLPGVGPNETSPAGSSLGSLFGGSASDVDAGAGFSGVAVIANATAVTDGVWQYSSDGGANWFAVGAVSDDASALSLSAGTLVRFLPTPGFEGRPAALVMRGMDDSHTGFSSTAGGSETRANVDSSSNGGTTSIAATTASLSTTVSTLAIDLDLIDPDPEPEPEPPAEDPSAEPDPEPDPEPEPEPEPETLLADSLRVDPGGGSSGPPPAKLGPDAPIIGNLPEPIAAANHGLEPSDRETREESNAASTARTALDVLHDIYVGKSNIDANTLAGLIFGGERGRFLQDLGVQEDVAALTKLETRMVSSSIAVTTGLSVGYVLWLTRGGLLIASLLSSLPAWRLIDPIPVLAHLGLDDEPEDEESLDSLVSQGAAEPTSEDDSEDQAPA